MMHAAMICRYDLRPCLMPLLLFALLLFLLLLLLLFRCTDSYSYYYMLLLLLFLTLLLAAVTSTYCRCSYVGGLCCNGWRCLELTAERLAEQQAEGSSVWPHRLKLAGNT